MVTSPSQYSRNSPEIKLTATSPSQYSRNSPEIKLTALFLEHPFNPKKK